MAQARTLIIYPTSRALRQLQRRALEQEPFFDGRGRISLSAFLGGCEEAARLAGLLRDESGRPLDRPEDLNGGVAVVEAAERFFAYPPLSPGVLGRLSRKRSRRSGHRGSGQGGAISRLPIRAAAPSIDHLASASRCTAFDPGEGAR